MDIFELPPGEKAPECADRIVLTHLEDGSFQIEAVIATGADAMFFSPPPFSSEVDALTAALLWTTDKSEGAVVLERREARAT